MAYYQLSRQKSIAHRIFQLLATFTLPCELTA